MAARATSGKRLFSEESGERGIPDDDAGMTMLRRPGPDPEFRTALNIDIDQMETFLD